MGKPTGFKEFQRQTPNETDPRLRILNWNESFMTICPRRNREARRKWCMDCGVPFCHTGTLMAGMAAGCPVNNLIPEWNDLVYRGHWREALDRLHKTNNFPEFTGRVCPAPCEGSCVLGIKDPAVTIKNIECSIIDHGIRAGLGAKPNLRKREPASESPSLVPVRPDWPLPRSSTASGTKSPSSSGPIASAGC